ncbi:MAG: phospho-sugar mutase [Proteobacteria bacterium]|nr:phospho-sugar mutase [Pseudomonadota bacterium]
MDQDLLDKARNWAQNSYFDSTFKKEIQELIATDNTAELTDRFYKDLEFGTGGLRGILGAGSNRMNKYTVQKATQGLASYIVENAPESSRSVVIAYDSRNFSEEFCQISASVLAGNGIKVHLFPQLRPTPMLSYAVRELGTTAGIVITASHNPPEYNGYKVYWDDGCQITSPHDTGVINKVNSIVDFSVIKSLNYEEGLKNKMIELVPDSLDQSYYDKVLDLSLGNKDWNKDFGVVFTPIHGSGNIPVREVLRRRGFEQVKVVKKQELPDGDFPTVEYPNPEEASALKLAIESAGDDDRLIIATDPDADRLGVMVKHHARWVRLNGNQIGQLLLNYYLEKLKSNGLLAGNEVFITTIVTSELGKKIASSYGVTPKETLTGFKYIAGLIRDFEGSGDEKFIFGNEESHGYLFGDFVRDKDAVSASMIMSELCAELAQSGKSVIDQLETIHISHGYHEDALVTKVIKGKSGAEKIKKIMESLRNQPPKSIANVKVVTIRDYQKGIIFDCEENVEKGAIDLPESNVLGYYLADGSRITARPSGTEPKIKFYFNLCGNTLESLQDAKKIYETEFMKMIEEI